MEREQDDLALSHRLLSLGAVALLAAAGALAFGRVFRGHAPTLKLLAAAVLSVGVAGVLERRGPILAVVGSGLGLLVTAGFLVFPKTVAVIFPTADTFTAFGRAIHHVGEQARVQVAPTIPLRPLLLAAVTAVWTASFAAHALAIRSGSPLLAALPPASLLAFADVLLDDGARPSYAALFLLGAMAVLFMDGLRRVRHWGPLRPWSGRGRNRLAGPTATRGARRVTVAALGAALLIPGALPGFQSPGLLKINSGDILSGPAVNPLVSVTASLKRRRPIDLFLVRAVQPAYWRWMSLDHFDGTTWTNSDLYVEHGQEVPAGSVLPQSPEEGAGLGVKTVDLYQTVLLLQTSSSPWLPMAFQPLTVSVGQSSIRYDSEFAAAVPEVGAQQGLSYTVRSQIELPTQDELDNVTDADISFPTYRRYEQLPSNTPREIYAIAHRITREASTPFRKLLAIQDYLHGFTYDPTVSGAYDTRTVLNFLTNTKRGFCQQFATAMAVLARALGYPARVAVGFTQGAFDAKSRGWRVSTDNAHSWVEVLFPGYGWLAFEPTPTRDNPVADSYLAPDRVPTAICQLQGTCANGRPTPPNATGGTNDARADKLADRESRQLGVTGDFPGAGAPAARPSGQPYRLPLLLFGIALALAFAAFLVIVPAAKIVTRRIRVARAGPPREVVLAGYRSFTARAGDLGLARGRGETLREYRDRLRKEVRFSDGHLDRLTAITARAAYSSDALSKEEAREALTAARKAIRDIRRDRPFPRRVLGLFRPGL